MKKHIILLSIFILFAAFAASSASDLGITDVGTLPSSRWYFFKEWGRGFERFFTFNSLKKAELELRITNEKAAEALKVQQDNPVDAPELTTAIKNYTSAAERLQARFTKLKETSENPNVAKLLEKLDEQTLKHADLLNQLAERYIGDPDFDLIANAVKDAQGKIQDVIRAAAQKEKNIEQKAKEQIKRAEAVIGELESELARISTNMTIEKQTPKKDFGDRMKAGLETAGGMLANAKTAFADGKFGEAFGLARSAEVLARNGLRIIITDIKKPTREGIDADTPRIEDKNSAMPIVPGTGGTEGKIIPEAEKRVFPETNNRQTPKAVEQKPAVTEPSSIVPAPTAPAFYEFKIEADDYGFYPESIIIVPKGSRVKIHFIARSTGIYYGGLDFRSSKFKTDTVKPGGTADVEFVADESFSFISYWPLTGVQKSSGKVVVQ